MSEPDDLKIIKKLYGENMMHLCRTLFPTILETKGLLSKLMLSKFAPNHDLYDDIKNGDYDCDFRNCIYSLIEPPKPVVEDDERSVKELMAEAGYDIYKCETEEDIQSFKKYYAPREGICTFQGGRLNSCHVFFAVKKNVDEIKRSPNGRPERQDEYGTSVISIQFTKEKNFVKITNRYNHTVENCDSTFSNNLDNIIPGLTRAFEREYDLHIGRYEAGYINIAGYQTGDDGIMYKYNMRNDNVFYCTNNIIIDNEKVIKDFSNKDKYIVMDEYILCLEKPSHFINYNDKNKDESFVSAIGKIDKISVTPLQNNERKISIKTKDDNNVEIVIDKNNKILDYSNEKVQEIGDDFMKNNRSLIKFSCPSLKKVGNNFLSSCQKIREFDFSTLEEAGDDFMPNNQVLEAINLSSLKHAGDNFLKSCYYLKKIEFPSLEEIGNNCLKDNSECRELVAPKLRKVGYSFFHNSKIGVVDLPSLVETSYDFMLANRMAYRLNTPLLTKVGDCFMNTSKVEKINLPNLEETENSFMRYNFYATELDAPKLRSVGNEFLWGSMIKEINLPSLEKTGTDFMYNNREVSMVNVPSLKDYKEGFLFNRKVNAIKR